MATPAVAHSSSSKSLAKELKPRIEKAEKAASELQIGEVYIKDKLKMAAETVTRMDKSKTMWSDLLRCLTKMHDGMAVMTEASNAANHVILQLSKLYRGDLGDTLRDIARYRNDIVEQYSKLAESLYDQFLAVVAKSMEPAAKEIDDKKTYVRKKTKEIEKQMSVVEKTVFKTQKKANQVQLQEAMRKYNEVKAILDVERAQVLETVLVMERNRFKFLIDAYSNVVKSEIILGETLSNQWKGLAQWETSLMTGLSVRYPLRPTLNLNYLEGEQAEALVTSREQSYKPLKPNQSASEPPQQPKAQAHQPVISAPLSGSGLTPSKFTTMRPLTQQMEPIPAPAPTATPTATPVSPKPDPEPPTKTTEPQRDSSSIASPRDSQRTQPVQDGTRNKFIGQTAAKPATQQSQAQPSPRLGGRTSSRQVSSKRPDSMLAANHRGGLSQEINRDEEDEPRPEQPAEDLDFGITSDDLKNIDMSKFSPASDEEGEASTSSESDVSFDIDAPHPQEDEPEDEYGAKPSPDPIKADSHGNIPIRRSIQLKSIDPSQFSRPPEPSAQEIKEMKKGYRQSISNPAQVDYSEGQALWKEIDADMKYVGGEVEAELKSLQTLRGPEYLAWVHAILDGENLQKALALVDEYEDLCDHFPEVFCLRENLQKKEKFKRSLQEIQDKLNAFVVQEIARASRR